MPDDIPILRSVRKSTQMGCHGIRAVLDESPNREIRTALRRQLAEYEELFCEADRLLHERGEKGRDISAVARLGSLTVSRMRVRTSPEPEAKIAELMVQGNTRGMLKSLHTCARSTPSTRRSPRCRRGCCKRSRQISTK